MGKSDRVILLLQSQKQSEKVKFHKLFIKQERFWNAAVSLAERHHSIMDSNRQQKTA